MLADSNGDGMGDSVVGIFFVPFLVFEEFDAITFVRLVFYGFLFSVGINSAQKLVS